VPANWQASHADTKSITDFISRFLDHVEKNNGAAAAEMMDPAMEATTAMMDQMIRDLKMHRTGAGTMVPQLVGWPIIRRGLPIRALMPFLMWP
jgi:hypothetical protein